MSGSVNPQLEPQRPRAQGLGASAVSLAAGGTASVTAAAGALVAVTVQSNGAPVTPSYTSGVTSYIPLSCPDPCEFILDGNPGSITFTWGTGAFAQTATLQIVAPAPIKRPPPIRVNLPGSPGTTSTTAGATSTGTKVAVGGAAVAGVGTLTLLLVSAATGWGISRTLDKLWDKITGKK